MCIHTWRRPARERDILRDVETSYKRILLLYCQNKDDLFIYPRNCMIASVQNEGEGRGNLVRQETGRDMSEKHWSIMFFDVKYAGI
jgi:hypothetical protein